MRKISVILLALIMAASIGAAYAQECCSKVSKVESKVSASAKVEAAVKKADTSCQCEAVKSGSVQDAKPCCGHVEKVDSEVKASVHVNKTIEGHGDKNLEHSACNKEKGSCCGNAEKHESGEKAQKTCSCERHESEKQKEKK